MKEELLQSFLPRWVWKYVEDRWERGWRIGEIEAGLVFHGISRNSVTAIVSEIVMVFEEQTGKSQGPRYQR